MKGYTGFLGIAAFLLIGTLFSCNQPSRDKEEVARTKIQALEALMGEAREQGIDVRREETLLWFSREFLKFANWDEDHKPEMERLFGYYAPYEAEKAQYAEELPDFERQKVIEMLDGGILTLKAILEGEIKRRAAVKIDWENVEVKEGMLQNDGRPVFLFDYFSKSVGIPLLDTNVYNDHLGAIFHGGEHLYAVDQDRAINPFLLREDRTFDPEKLSLLTDISDKNTGFLLFWNSGMPEWIHEREPEVAKGRSLFTGFDVDNPLMREVWRDIAIKSAELNRGKKVTELGYILSNEPHWFSEKGHWTQQYREMNEISSYTLNKFRDWLSRKYEGNIDLLNQNWQSSFSDFGSVEIEIPIAKSLRGQPIWYDWCRYNMDRGTEWFSFLQDALHSADPEAHTHIKIMPKMFSEDYRSHGIDLEALTELTTMIGNDAKTSGGRSLIRKKPEKWEERYAYFWEELALPYDFMESVAPDKVNINSETHFLSSSHWRDLNTPTTYTRNTFWLATLHGMDAGISWFWARDPDGSPEDRLEGELNFFDPALAGSYAGSVNMQPQTANEVAQVMYDLNSFSEEIIALRNQRKPLRIFYSETAAINQPTYMSDMFEQVYEPLYFEGFPLGFVTEKILKKQDHSQWDAVLVHHTEHVTDAEFEALQAYLNKGGTLIIDGSNSLSKNEYGQIREKKLKEAAGRLISLEGQKTTQDLKEAILTTLTGSLPEVIVTEANGTEHKGCTWRVVKNPEGSYWLTAVNLGKQSASLTLALRNGENPICTNMLTGQALGNAFDLPPMGVCLMEIQAEK